MSSYRGEVGAWDGGPPGAEADYAPQQGLPLAAPVPTTDPWTGVSYSQYGQPQYDYQAYSAPGYGYNYDSTYYQRPECGFYDNSRAAYSATRENYDYNKAREHSRSKRVSRDYDRQRSSYRSHSRSPSPYNREREYSKKRESSYEERRRRSRSASKAKHAKYSSSDRSSRSRSYSESPSKKDKKTRRSESSNSSRSDRSYKYNAIGRDKHSATPPLKGSSSRNKSYTKEKVKSRSPRYSREKSKGKKFASRRKSKSKDRKEMRDVFTPPKDRSVSPKSHKRSNRSSASPPATYKKAEHSPRSKSKHRDRRSRSSPRKPRDSSVTPPRCYARSRSTSTSRSRSRSLTPRSKRKQSPKSARSRSSSSSGSSVSSRSHSTSRQRRRKSPSKLRSRSKSGSRDRSTKSRSKSRHHSNSRFRGRRSRSAKGSKSRSRSRSSRSRSRSRTPSDEECRGQFTVADRKRFWKLHRNRQAERCKTPTQEVKPPPGAVESTAVDDIMYGDPPEVEGPNFADLLPTPDQVMQAPSTSKSKPLPIPIKNDGSFLEMFKKMQEETKKAEVAEKKPEIKKPVLPFIGKRRGGRVLKTGLVKKAKAIDEQTVDNTPKDAWSLYMQEVKKYRETSCEEERKTRPLVK